MTIDPRTRRLAISTLLIAVAFSAVYWPGCRSYPPVSSAESVNCIRLLYSACTDKDKQRLDDLERRLISLELDHKLSEKESSSFRAIIASARAGNWDAATQETHRFAEEQVNR